MQKTKRLKPIQVNLDSLVMNRMPPHDLSMEEAVLGALMLEKGAIYEVIDLLDPSVFYAEKHQLIYEAILHLFNKGHHGDILLVVEQLKKSGALEVVGGPLMVTRLTNAVVSTANLKSHALVIKESYMRRQLAKLNLEFVTRSYDLTEDIFDLLDFHQIGLDAIYNSVNAEVRIDAASALGELRKKIEKGMSSGGMTGVPTGHPVLDEWTGGWQPETLITTIARTRHGKTAYAIAHMHAVTKIPNPSHDPYDPRSHWSLYPMLLFSMEMPQAQAVARMVSAELVEMGIYLNYNFIERGKLNEEEALLVTQAMERLSVRGFYIDPTPALTTQAMRAKISRAKKEHGIVMAVGDYIQLMSDPPHLASNKPAAISQNMQDIKTIAKQEYIPINMLSQADRNTEKGTERPPKISDGVGSAGIENSSDIIQLLYRPEVNNPYPVDEEDGSSLKGIIINNIGKNKQGPGGIIKIPFDVVHNCFGDLSEVPASILDQYKEKTTIFNV